MAVIHPFRALRPAPERAADVSSVPYDVVSTEEARQLTAGNPLSFLRVTRSEVDLPEATDPYSAAVYEKARDNCAALRRTAPLIVDGQPSVYLYRLRMGDHEQTGVAGCFSLDEYDSGVIKKHERTRRDKEDDRTRHIVGLRAQTGVVFLAFKQTRTLARLIDAATGRPPLYDFRADDGVSHTVWRIGDESTAFVDAFKELPALYIADGHHRAASAARARAELARGEPASEANTFIAVAFPDDRVQILPYNRLVKDLGGHTSEGFLDRLRARLPVKEGGPAPIRKGQVSMYAGGAWYSIDLSSAAPADASRAASLDVALLQQHVLEPLLNVGDIRTDKRIDFVGGARGTVALKRAVDTGQAAVAFSMFPVTIDDLMSIADEGGIMPPKSTWFEPKLRDGLLVHLI
jgi:uncharacterized protein (DUF1015 family)